MKLNDPNATPYWYQAITGMYQRHLEILRKLLTDSADRAQRFLILTNGGGLIATLSFMGAAQTVRENRMSWCVAGCFFVGVVLVGFLSAVNYHQSKNMMWEWISDTDAALQSKIDADEPIRRLNATFQTFGRGTLPALLGWAAFIAFIVGGSIALLTLPPR